jgi:hypothetical protein
MVVAVTPLSAGTVPLCEWGAEVGTALRWAPSADGEATMSPAEL